MRTINCYLIELKGQASFVDNWRERELDDAQPPANEVPEHARPQFRPGPQDLLIQRCSLRPGLKDLRSKASEHERVLIYGE